jgi:hypothetical protein
MKAAIQEWIDKAEGQFVAESRKSISLPVQNV